MYNRAEIVDKNFISIIQQSANLAAKAELDNGPTSLKDAQLIDLLETAMLSRLLDLHARTLRAQDQCFYTIGSSGHEAMAALALATHPKDPALLHYRDCAFYIQRAKQYKGFPYLYNLLLSFSASKEDPISGGRHKVLGAKELNIPPQTSTIASHLPKALGIALSIPRAKALKVKSEFSQDAITLCHFGDASYNHSTALGAINCSRWIAYQNIPIPVLWVCEDNDKGISVPTPERWIASNTQSNPAMKYFFCDGRNFIDVYQTSLKAVQYVRQAKKPAFLHIKTVRLLGHAGSDIELSYQNLSEIERNEARDPLLSLALNLIQQKILNSDEVLKMYRELKLRIEAVSKIIVNKPKLTDAHFIASSIVNHKHLQSAPTLPSLEVRREYFGKEWQQISQPQTMAKNINWALTDILAQYPQTLVFGEDVAKKGGVYHITANLQKRFGPKRIFNSLLDEQSILGTAIGFAHNGFIPIPEIQFLAYVHNAEDQIRGEAATLPFFSSKKFFNPMVIRIAGLAYQKGFGGHYHNDNSFNVFRDIPGIFLACPSRPSDAAKMLRGCVKAAYEKKQVHIFLEPIALYNTRDLIDKNDEQWSEVYPSPEEIIEPGELGYYPADKNILIISYGNGFYLTRKAITKYKKDLGFIPSLLDLRWLIPLNVKEICKIAKKYKKILIVDECRKTASLSEELFTLLHENIENVKVQRLCSDDCFIPLGPAADKVLLQPEDIFKSLQDLEVHK